MKKTIYFSTLIAGFIGVADAAADGLSPLPMSADYDPFVNADPSIIMTESTIMTASSDASLEREDSSAPIEVVEDPLLVSTTDDEITSTSSYE